MKVRLAHVTNSSSSSFVCQICHYAAEGYDCSPEDLGMVQCKNLHLFCEEEELTPTQDQLEKYLEQLKETYRESCIFVEREDDFINGKIKNIEVYDETYDERLKASCYCPICNFNVILQKDIMRYLKAKYRVKNEKVMKYIRAKDKSRNNFYDSEYIKYVCEENNLNPVDFADIWKVQFKTYEEFDKYCE